MNKTISIILAIMLIPNLCWAGIDLDGTDDSITTSYNTDLINFTVSIWVRSPNAPALDSGADSIIDRGTNFTFQWNHNDINFVGALSMKVGSTWYAASFGTLSANTWYNLIATYNGETIVTYRNGTTATTNTNPSGNPVSTAANLVFGVDDIYFNGIVTEAAIWNMVLSTTQIAQLSGNRPTVSNSAPVKGLPLQLLDPDADGVQELVLYVPMDEGTHGNSADLDTCWDLSGSGNNGNPDNGANNTGLTWSAETILSYPSPILTGM